MNRQQQIVFFLLKIKIEHVLPESLVVKYGGGHNVCLYVGLLLYI